MAYMRGISYVYSDGYNLHFDDIHIPNCFLDEYVVMRHAELTDAQRKRIEKRALRKHSGNFGCDGLSKKNGLPTVMEKLRKKHAIPQKNKK